ncbi:BolA family protein [Candidatus Venteria ishoeyi]|uniref:Transcriptional regulator BolA n=1 Tax=Candidatus Venteria ishoeyi TaxID=1899563 RepID=A0A1H6F4W0_9GAMM|nr:BolA family protein [Candidatus Venteria ishoeyi]SEH05197.1 transcriptional regulator BolA [Candidatus Venteria ishoeyi]
MTQDDMALHNQQRMETLKARLTAALSPAQLNIIDDSQHHAGHASAKGGAHFTIEITSTAFQGKTLVQQHRLVYEAAGDLMDSEIHALSIRSKAG